MYKLSVARRDSIIFGIHANECRNSNFSIISRWVVVAVVQIDCNPMSEHHNKHCEQFGEIFFANWKYEFDVRLCVFAQSLNNRN